MFRLRGDPQQLTEIADKLKAAAGEALPEISEQLAEEALNFAREGFDNSKNPYGERWRGRKRTTGRSAGKALLVASGVMRKSVNVAQRARGFVLGFGQAYAAFHQWGTRKMVQRMLVPTSARGLPSKWVREFNAVVQDVFDELFD